MADTPYLRVPPAATASRDRPRLPALLGAARNLVRDALARHAPGNAQGPVLLACSGGADSLALAVAAAHLHRTGTIELGAVVVDHQIQPDSAAVAQRTAEVLHGLGLNRVDVRTVAVQPGPGPEAAARDARYRALGDAVRAHRAAALLLGHTMNDSAEQVLLGLVRGSGTRSLAGIRGHRLAGGAHLLRPFLTLRRSQTEEICRLGGVVPWMDPSNADQAFTRNRVRNQMLPELEAQLGQPLVPALARSAQILGQDADALDGIAAGEFARIVTVGDAQTRVESAELRRLHPAIAARVLRAAVTSLGAPPPSWERVQALSALTENRGSAGPIQLEGSVSAYRQNRAQRLAGSPGGAGCGSIVLTRDA